MSNAAESRTDATRDRLIEAGTEAFAAHGFRGASIREICRQAEANPAAVNYHFGDKERFYAEVLVTAHQQAVARRPMPRLADDPEHPRVVLRSWIRWFLDLLLSDESSALGRLMAREMFQPTAALEELVLRSIRPTVMTLAEIVLGVVGPTRRALVIRSVQSILGQCLFYKHSQPAMEHISKLDPPPELQVFAGLPDKGPMPWEMAQDLDALADGIAEFSLGGIERIKEDKT